MEKLIYVLTDAGDAAGGRHDRVAAAGVEAARAVGGERIAVFVPDQTDEIRDRSPGRIGGAWERVAAVFECWLPNLDDRGAVEERLRPLVGELWGYLVTESTMAPCPHEVEDGTRVPGITQWGMNDKPASVSIEDFHREWAVHSELSFDLHPKRDSYIRNAIVRSVTAEAPTYLGIVLERFPTLDVFVDDSLYFGDPAVVKRMIEHVPSFYEFSTAITGGMSEYRWR